MSDLIYRQAAIDAANRTDYRGLTVEEVMNVTDEVVKELQKLPTAEPERKIGKWIKEYWHSEHTRKCSACNTTQTVMTYRGKVNFNYCPYCGAKMTRGEE